MLGNALWPILKATERSFLHLYPDALRLLNSVSCHLGARPRFGGNSPACPNAEPPLAVSEVPRTINGSGTNKMKQEVVKHGCDAVDHDGVGENSRDLSRHHLQCVDCLIAHDVVEPRQHARVSISILGFSSLVRRQILPLPALSLFLLLSYLHHVLSTAINHL